MGDAEDKGVVKADTVPLWEVSLPGTSLSDPYLNPVVPDKEEESDREA